MIGQKNEEKSLKSKWSTLTFLTLNIKIQLYAFITHIISLKFKYDLF